MPGLQEPSSVGLDPLAKAPRRAKLLRRFKRSVPQTPQKVLEDLPLLRKQLDVLFPACRSPDDHCLFPFQSPKRCPGGASLRFSPRLLAPASRMAARPRGGGTPRPAQRPASRGLRLGPSSRPVPAPLRALALVRTHSTSDYLKRLRPLCLALRSALFVHRRRVPHSGWSSDFTIAQRRRRKALRVEASRRRLRGTGNPGGEGGV